MSALAEALRAIFDRLDRLGSSLPAQLRPGLAAPLIVRKLSAAGLAPEPAIVELYAIGDGAGGDAGALLDEIDFFAGFHWLALDEALSCHDALADDVQWARGWLPVFANGGGDFYAVICDADDPNAGAVVGFVFGEPDQIIEFPSLGAMLRVIEASYAEGATALRDGYLVTDYPQMRAIARRVSPLFEPILLGTPSV